MLPWLQRLHDYGEVVFLFATNTIMNFDAAIRREGRFDLVVPIGPPQGPDRLEALKGRCKGVDEGVLASLAAGAREWATVGDILRAMRSTRDDSGSISAGKVLSFLHGEGRLTIDESTWNDFMEHARRYVPET
jgi:SpoVK/Ycf46/Vps4 family AAA+-type ATPase